MRFYGATTSQSLRASSHSLSLSFGQPAPSRGSHDGRHDGEPKLPRGGSQHFLFPDSDKLLLTGRMAYFEYRWNPDISP